MARPDARIPQNYRLIWVDLHLHRKTPFFRDTVQRLRTVVHAIDVFDNPDSFVDYLQGVVNEKVFVMTSGTLCQQLIPLIHPMEQVDTIYIFCSKTANHTSWAADWLKIGGVFKDVIPICEHLRDATRRCDRDLTPLSYISLDESTAPIDLHQLDSTFMYTRLFKSVQLETKYDDRDVKELIRYYRSMVTSVPNGNQAIDEFQDEYDPSHAIRWYSRNCFIGLMLDRAIRLLDVETMVNMGFFIQDVHRQLDALHKMQHFTQPFTVYRGQRMAAADFDKLKQTQGGLLSFNSFVTAITDRAIALRSANDSSCGPNNIRILFAMAVDPATASTPFANIDKISYFHGKTQILFSMHSLFRIDQTVSHDGSIFEIGLTLVNDSHTHVHTLAKQLNLKAKGSAAWTCIGNLLIRAGQLAKAEELYSSLTVQTCSSNDRALYQHQWGYIKNRQGDYERALTLHTDALALFKKAPSVDQQYLAASYSNIGLVCKNMARYSDSIFYYKQAFDIDRKIRPDDHLHLATSHSNLGSIYTSMSDYAKALSSYEKALAIVLEQFPTDHPHRATVHSNLASAHKNIGDSSKALACFEEALSIRLKALPSTHPQLGTSYTNIASVYNDMGEHSKALSFHEKALDIFKQTRPINRTHLATAYSNIGLTQKNMGDYATALQSLEEALAHAEKLRPENPLYVATCHNNIGAVYAAMSEFSKALFSFEITLKIRRRVLPHEHPDIRHVLQWITAMRQSAPSIS